MRKKGMFFAALFVALCSMTIAEPEKKVLQLTGKDVDKALMTFIEIRKLHQKLSPADLTFLQAGATVKEVETLLKKNYPETELFSQHLSAVAGALAFLQSEELLNQLQNVPKNDLPAAAVALFKEQENNFRKVLQEQRQDLSDETVAAVKARKDEIMKIFEIPQERDEDEDEDDDDED